jgi:hypothetical protein
LGTGCDVLLAVLAVRLAVFVAGNIVDMKELGVWEPYVVKTQTIKTAIESATLLLRIDDIVSGIHRPNKPGPGQQTPGPQADDGDQVSLPLPLLYSPLHP